MGGFQRHCESGHWGKRLRLRGMKGWKRKNGRITRVLAILLILVNVMPLFHLVGGMAGGLFQKYESQSESAEVWHMELDREYQVYDDTLILEDIYYLL